MSFNCDPRSLLQYTHPDLAKVCKRAAELSAVPFIVTESVRSKEIQLQNVANGKSLTMKSRHLPSADGLSRAIDVAAFPDEDLDGKMDSGELSWVWKYYTQIAAAFMLASSELKIPIEWGGSWKKLADGPHFQLPWKDYP